MGPQIASRPLVIGWFSFELMGSTAGDVMAKDVARRWLRSAGFDSLVAVAGAPGPGEILTASVVPEAFDTVIFVCGPIGDGPPLNEFLARFPHARKFALNVSLLQTREQWNPFVHVVERDSTVRTNPDITLAAPPLDVPVVGEIYVGPQSEYPSHQHERAEAMIRGALRARDVAVVPICTRLDVNQTGLWSAAQIESLIARMDAVCSTRLHGAVIALRRGVPVVAVDSVPGGTKLLKQMRRLGWPLAFDVSAVSEAEVGRALDLALTADARELARRCADRARADLAAVEREFLTAVTGGGAP